MTAPDDRDATASTPPRPARRVAVIGGGITGAAAAHHLGLRRADGTLDHVVLFEAEHDVGGRSLTTPFAGLDHVDCGPDAFLARVPDATALAAQVGVVDELVHPERVGAAVWYDGMHDIPDGLVLGVPGNPLSLARSSLLSWRGKARAALEPLLPRTSTEPDSIGEFVRARFGDEVHERLVDALVGSIYATDTDRFSLAEMPQLAALTSDRSLLAAARRTATKGTASAAASPIFATPAAGMQRLTTSTVAAARSKGVEVRTGRPVVIESAPGASEWAVDGERFDAVIVATPAGAALGVLGAVAPDTVEILSRAETSDVALLSLHVDGSEWPDRLGGRSGYLVPKPVQRSVTAVSFASQKWAHWQPPGGGQILRVSLGRDGAPVLHLSDEELVERALDDLHLHLGVRFSPTEVRVSRWPGAFAQYRPHHRRWVEALRATLPSGIAVAGSAYDGIGIPACVRSGRTIAERVVDHLAPLPH
ncbi:MAG: protoporphyrinogen oxidase [Ilumatobacter sp.]|uniref:protoporphyrinogen oxidase n=1 Tax=Ilumatobacter sp. TaxID=1967498 RepID=UPI003299E04A